MTKISALYTHVFPEAYLWPPYSLLGLPNWFTMPLVWSQSNTTCWTQWRSQAILSILYYYKNNLPVPLYDWNGPGNSVSCSMWNRMRETKFRNSHRILLLIKRYNLFKVLACRISTCNLHNTVRPIGELHALHGRQRLSNFIVQWQVGYKTNCPTNYD
jgi:hypothetical protein